LIALLFSSIYIRNPTVIDKVPIVTGKQPEPTITPPSVSVIPSTTDNNGTIKVAEFNLQIFGTSKANKPEVMEVLSKTIRNSDIVAVQEIRNASQTSLPLLRDAINSIGSPQYELCCE
jgi:hypothetical protein